ncbi:MAG: hypothetical protein ABI474_04120 [Actinomycetota bacterium]
MIDVEFEANREVDDLLSYVKNMAWSSPGNASTTTVVSPQGPRLKTIGFR